MFSDRQLGIPTNCRNSKKKGNSLKTAGIPSKRQEFLQDDGNSFKTTGIPSRWQEFQVTWEFHSTMSNQLLARNSVVSNVGNSTDFKRMSSLFRYYAVFLPVNATNWPL